MSRDLKTTYFCSVILEYKFHYVNFFSESKGNPESLHILNIRRTCHPVYKCAHAVDLEVYSNQTACKDVHMIARCKGYESIRGRNPPFSQVRPRSGCSFKPHLAPLTWRSRQAFCLCLSGRLPCRLSQEVFARSLEKLLAPTSTTLFLLSLTSSTLDTKPPAPPWSRTEIANCEKNQPLDGIAPSISCWCSSRAMIEAIGRGNYSPWGNEREKQLLPD